jgi:2-oxoglutarate dehydrogenase E2 component (dihydrolipoamide succinyltransferase)
MTTEVRVPTLGESVTEATVGAWLKQPGDQITIDEQLTELETDKVTLEVNAPVAGVLQDIVAEEGTTVEVGSLIAVIDETAVAVAGGAEKAAPAAAQAEPAMAEAVAPATAQAPAAPPPMAPSVRKLVHEHDLDPNTIPATGKGGRLVKGDVLSVLEGGATAAPAPALAPAPAPAPAPAQAGPRPRAAREERVRMTRLRKRIAERLKEAQNTAAMLTTFNEADMTEVMAARAEYKDLFEKKHGVRLGFMSFFVKAVVTALHDIPAVNAEIDGDEIVYKNYYDIGVAVSAPTGLVVPVVRDADEKGFADIEKTIHELGVRARDGKLRLEDLQGGTFTISNGGVFGSLMSAPILNPPQSGILGMHKIQNRPVAMGDQVVIRPMMYLALSYDHRVIDGREAVTFLVRVKECIEDPKRLLLDL